MDNAQLAATADFGTTEIVPLTCEEAIEQLRIACAAQHEADTAQIAALQAELDSAAARALELERHAATLQAALDSANGRLATIVEIASGG